MVLNYQPKKKKGETITPERKYAIKEIRLSDGTIMGVFEGNRGHNPDHDILIKYKEKNKQLRTPKHIHWVIDLLIKKQHNKELTLKFMKYLRGMYDCVDACQEPPITDGWHEDATLRVVLEHCQNSTRGYPTTRQ